MLWFIKEENSLDTSGVHTLFPTWWSVHTDTLASIVANYTPIQQLWYSTLSATRDTEMKANIQGVKSQIETFSFFFSINLSELISTILIASQHPVTVRAFLSLRVQSCHAVCSDPGGNALWEGFESFLTKVELTDRTWMWMCCHLPVNVSDPGGMK